MQLALQDEPRRSRGVLGPSLAEHRPKTGKTRIPNCRGTDESSNIYPTPYLERSGRVYSPSIAATSYFLVRELPPSSRRVWAGAPQQRGGIWVAACPIGLLYVTQQCFWGGNRASGPDFVWVLIGKASKSGPPVGLRPAGGRILKLSRPESGPEA